LKKRRNADLFITRGDGKWIYSLRHDFTRKFAHQAKCDVTKGRDFDAVLKEPSLTIHKAEPAAAKKSTTKTQAESTADAITRLRFTFRLIIHRRGGALGGEDQRTKMQEKKQFADLLFQD
jgi:hypothetical protein